MDGGARIVMYATGWCPYCARARQLFQMKGLEFEEIDIDEVEGARAEMQRRSGRTSVPQIFINDCLVGGYDDTKALDDEGQLDPLLAGMAGA